MSASAAESPLLVIVGPTASGKSALGIALAKSLGGEIVSCDSVQMYRGFDIGSAKAPEAEREGVVHHLLDVLSPVEKTTAGDYARMARRAIEEVRRRDRLPILVGGTGLYLRATLRGLFNGPGRDEALRARLEQIADRKGSRRLHAILARVDSESALRIHWNDRPKLIRAIEVCLVGRRRFSEALREDTEEPLEGYRVTQIGLAPPRHELYARIDQRTKRMFAEGIVEEVRRLLDAGVPQTAWPFGAVGYKQALAAVKGDMDAAAAAEAAAQATRRYAKRQMTWFRQQEPGTVWLEGFGDDPEIREAARAITG
jgi:tRNA dimethylallyltransferase